VGRVAACLLLGASLALQCEPPLAEEVAAQPKPSSYAPQARAKKRVYGAPVQSPILHSHRSPHRRPGVRSKPPEHVDYGRH
jgi:hypothetical protein